jgi:two-component system heavy metal sensor histidine kinase CusS
MRARLSIFGTLVLWFTAAGFLILAAMSYFLFRTYGAAQNRQQRETLASRMHDIITDLQSAEEDPVGEELDRIRASIARQPRLGVAIREQGRVLLATGTIPSAAKFPPPSSDLAQLPVLRFDDDEREFLLTSAQVTKHGHSYVVDLALDDSADREALDDFRTNAYIALLAAAVMLALAGALVARQAMRPLERITAATQRLELGRLDDRLEASSWPAELRALAAELARMQTRLSESFERLSQFSDDLAHELRTPINNLMGAAEVALGRPRPPEEYRETLGSMLEEAQRLSRMIDELLFLARAEHPESALGRVPLDAREEAAAVFDYYSAVADEKQIALSIEGAGTVFADRALLRRALGNLLANALRYTPAGGNVRIAIHESERETRIEVHDSGAGIEARHLPHLFDRFYRVDEARAHAEGTGLGLSIVKSIVELHRGTIDVVSEPGRGSTFTLHMTKL